jgi:hypothetical protein
VIKKRKKKNGYYTLDPKPETLHQEARQRVGKKTFLSLTLNPEP